MIERECRLEQRPKCTRGPRGRRDRVPKVSIGQLCNRGLWELLPASSGPASPGVPLSRALFSRY